MTNQNKGILFAFASALAMWAGIVLATSLAITTEAHAQSSSCQASAAAPTYTPGLKQLSCDLAGNLRSIASGGATGSNTNITATGGNLLVNDAATAGTTTPLPVGGIASLAGPFYSAGQRAQMQFTPRGQAVVMPSYISVTSADGVATTTGYTLPATSNDTGGAVTVPASGLMLFNGASWKRGFACESTVPISVALGTTTQLVALAASQQIRVCNFVVSGDTIATTAQFIYGTGAACATGPTNLTGAMRLQDEGNISMSAAAGGSLFRTAASNALCIVSTVGAVTGFLTYTQF